ncbi:hypothetical protein KUTeg_003380 [Tegillarca granosa]|uniref:Uncharacterized protein n=1 Tax=Tegillarca granosa TaxID=220873 RepID=A0ABQ9FM06_TEGGR|nr:hypothetical protein KUTeg_003380 [Tegillarca granosa]
MQTLKISELLQLRRTNSQREKIRFVKRKKIKSKGEWRKRRNKNENFNEEEIQKKKKKKKSNRNFCFYQLTRFLGEKKLLTNF